MPNQPIDPDELGALPTFPEVDPDDELSLDPDATRILTPDHDQTSPEHGRQSTTSTQLPPPSPSRPGLSDDSSSLGSIEPTAEALLAMEQLAGALAGMGGMVVNRVTRRSDARWLLTDEEAQLIGSVVGKMAARRAPAELVSGDGAEMLAIGSVTVGYLARNLLNLTPEDMARAVAAQQAEHAAAAHAAPDPHTVPQAQPQQPQGPRPGPAQPQAPRPPMPGFEATDLGSG
jgi:hypothetical protein